MLFEVRLLGQFSVRRGGEEIAPAQFGGRLARVLLRVLITRRGRFTPTDVLTEALWGERLPADPTGNLKVLVNRARRALRESSLIVTGSGGYMFAEDERCVVDTEQFLARTEAARRPLARGDPEAALGEFLAALQGWGGEPLAEDAYADWAQQYRARLERAHLQALEEGAAAALEAGHPEQAVVLAEQAATREPYREAAYTLLMRALATVGDTAAALDTYETLRCRLAEDLGLSPARETAGLHVRILQGERVAPPPRSSGAYSVFGPAAGGVRPFQPLAFVGRALELDALLEGTRARAPCRALVIGPAGVGKSRLLAEVAVRSLLPTIEVRAFPAERQEPWALARSVLREALNLDLHAAAAVPDRAAQALADVLPELEELRPVPAGPAAAESRRALALEGAVRLLEHAVPKGALVVVDDLQWTDATSLGFVELALRRVPRLGAILAYRPDEVPADAPVTGFLAELVTEDLLAVTLGPLDDGDIAELVASEELRSAIVEETDRTPLTVGEVLRALAAQGEVGLGPCGRWRTRTPAAAGLAREAARAGQRRVTQGRVGRLPPRRREVLALLALVGREVPARVVAEAAAAQQAEVLDDLDALARAGLVRLGDEGWTAAHSSVAEAVAAGLGRPQRGRLHALLAEALVSHAGEPAEVARHLAAAGDSVAAVEAFVQAGRRSLERFASEEAAQLANEGLRLRPSPQDKIALLEVRAEARARLAKSAGACEDLRAVIAATDPGPRRALLLSRLASLASSAEGYERAAELVELSLAEAGMDSAARAQALATGVIVDLHTGRPDRAEARAAEAVALFEQVGDNRGVASVLEARAMRTAVHGRLGEAAELLDRAARLFRDCGELLRAGTPRSNRGLLLLMMGRPEEGLADIDEALELERLLGHLKGEYSCLWARVQALIELGRVREAYAQAEVGTPVVRSLGNREGLSAWLLVVGMARQAARDLEGAEAALRECLEMSKGLPMFHPWAAARLASVLVARGQLAAAEPLVAESLAVGVPVTHHAARLAGAELAVARGDPDAVRVATEALELAEAQDHLATAARLRSLLGSLGQQAR